VQPAVKTKKKGQATCKGSTSFGQCYIVSKLDGLLNPERDLMLITGGKTVGVKTSEH
jgi:hypothetical protein